MLPLIWYMNSQVQQECFLVDLVYPQGPIPVIELKMLKPIAEG